MLYILRNVKSTQSNFKIKNEKIWDKSTTHMYWHFSYYKATTFFSIFESYNFTPNHHVNHNPVCIYSSNKMSKQKTHAIITKTNTLDVVLLHILVWFSHMEMTRIIIIISFSFPLFLVSIAHLILPNECFTELKINLPPNKLPCASYTFPALKDQHFHP